MAGTEQDYQDGFTTTSEKVEFDPTTRKVTVYVSRKKSDDNYGGTEVGVWVEGYVPQDADEATVAKTAKALIRPAKAVVLDEVGIEAVADDNGVLRERLVPRAQVESRVRQEVGGTRTLEDVEDDNLTVGVWNKNTKTWDKHPLGEAASKAIRQARQETGRRLDRFFPKGNSQLTEATPREYDGQPFVVSR